MLDKVIGQDEHLHKARREGDGRKPKGGEEVLIDAFNNDAIQPRRPSELPNAKKEHEPHEADYPYQEEESSYDEEDYEDDFHDLMQEIVQE